MDSLGFGFDLGELVAASGSSISSGALSLLAGDDGLALDFTDDTWLTDSGFYGSAAVVGGGTQDGYDTSPDTASASLLTYTSPSLKMTMGPSGVLRFGAHNLCLQSQTFDNASWTKSNCTISANSVTAPDGTLTADTLVEASDVGQIHQVFQSITANNGATYTCTAYAKAVGRTWFAIDFEDASVHRTFFDLTNGVVGTNASGNTAEISSAGNGWYKCSVTRVMTDTTIYPVLQSASADGTVSYNGTGIAALYLWGAHVRRTPSDSTYLATTSAARYALPYQWTTAGVLEGILVEEARTNLHVQSQDFTNGAWNGASVMLANQAVAPDGTTSADAIVETGSSLDHRNFDNLAVASATTYTASIFAKAGTRSWVQLALNNGTASVYFDLTNGVKGTETDTISSSIVSAGNGWYRLSFTATTSGTSHGLSFGTVTANGGSTSYTGVTNAQAAYFWGAQLEAGSFPTSYIPTIASTVTRAADNISLGVAAFPYSATAGTLKVSATPRGNIRRFASLDDGSNNETLSLSEDSGQVLFNVQDGGVNQAFIRWSTWTNDVPLNLAGAYAANDFVGVKDGGTPQTDVSGTLPTPTALYFGSGNGGNFSTLILKNVVYFPTRKTNAELQTLTGA